MEPTAEQRQLVSFVERDYEIAQAAASSTQTAVVASRSIGFSLLAALFGFGLTQDNGLVLLLTSLTGFAVYLTDAYYTWRLGEYEGYLRKLEAILRIHYAALHRAPANQRELARLQKRLALLRVGATSRIRKFKWRDAWFIPPAPLFRLLYPCLLIFAIGATGYIGIRESKADEHPQRCRPHARLVSGACKPDFRPV